jgi:hypothetical protein
MDDKTLNLWRQIEDGRRRRKANSPERAKPDAQPVPETAAN